MFGTINLGGMFVFACLIPETKGRSLEDMDVLFGSVSAEQRHADIVKRERVLEHEQEHEETSSQRSVREKSDRA
jgi:hypothetical protein